MNPRFISVVLLWTSFNFCANADPDNSAFIRTPPAPDTPRINGPTVFGVRPGSPFLYTIPATGDRPMTFSVENLPNGLSLNSTNGQITGSLQTKGEYAVVFHAMNEKGETQKKFRIVVGKKIALTPPMGWNSWNCWAWTVSQQKVLRSARAMAASGLINHGWTYINIDDTWQGARAGKDHAIPTPAIPANRVTMPTVRGPKRCMTQNILGNTISLRPTRINSPRGVSII